MSIRDHLPGAGRRRDQPAPTDHHKSKTCEMRGCPCIRNGQHTGGGDIAIHNLQGVVLGYVCVLGYEQRLRALGKHAEATWKPTGAQLSTVQRTLNEQRGMRHVQDIVNDFDRYAESMAHIQDDDHA